MEKNRVEKNLHFLLLLVGSSNYKQKKQLIVTASTKQLLAVLEVVKNVLFGRLSLSVSYKKELAVHASIFKTLINKKVKIEQKRILILKNLSVVLKFISSISKLGD
jgi:uncharacterized protein YeeX (DUF496 family)